MKDWIFSSNYINPAWRYTF